MKVKDISKEELEIEKISGKREKLEEKLPLEVPYSIQVMTANVCNLECEFCDCSIKNRKISNPFLSESIYKKFIDSVSEKHWKLKQIILTGIGEPLLNKNIDSFIGYAKNRKIMEHIDLITNGVLLNKEMADRLIKVELDVIRVSINGLSDEEYERYTGKKIDFKQLVKNIEYYYNNKKPNMKVYVKIMNYMVKSEEKKKKFFSLFESIADVVNIENIAELSTDIEYDSIISDEQSVGIKGAQLIQTDICTMGFYSCVLNTNGSISACCVAGPRTNPPSLVMGNIMEHEIDEIWNGSCFCQFRLDMLQKGVLHSYPECKVCKGYLASMHPEDVIENHKERIIKELLFSLDNKK